MKGKTHSTEEIIRILRQADGGGSGCGGGYGRGGDHPAGGYCSCGVYHWPEQSRAGGRSDSDPDS